MIIEEIRSRLFEMRDEEYREFHSRLVPNIPKEKIIGVRTPQMRAYARELAKREDIDEFLNELPHKYYEESNLHIFIISAVRDYEKALEQIDRFLPYVDNWATCDQPIPPAFKKNPDLIKKEIFRWISSEEVYVRRYGINCAMQLFLGENYDELLVKSIAEIRSGEYYVRMMIAWFFATAMAKNWDKTVKYIENKSLDEWTHNKAIQKAVESLRITKEQKEYLKGLKIRTK